MLAVISVQLYNEQIGLFSYLIRQSLLRENPKLSGFKKKGMGEGWNIVIDEKRRQLHVNP